MDTGPSPAEVTAAAFYFVGPITRTPIFFIPIADCRVNHFSYHFHELLMPPTLSGSTRALEVQRSYNPPVGRPCAVEFESHALRLTLLG